MADSMAVTTIKRRHFRVLVLSWLVLAIYAGGSLAMARDVYLSLAPDIPLAPGLEELEGGQLVFDKPEGRIVQIETRQTDAARSAKNVRRYYLETLPNLGWQKASSSDRVLTFQRGGETLLITLKGERVVFELSPGQAPVR
ncbi:MAG TPA: hypothetical protein DIT66_01990 [Rhodobiaceae bacterium]|nr:MAG: Uncharacterised protein [Rhodobiaceae bacterium UBA7378]HCQ81567.1 hypothetical protein [Rhodobiaceae bacterium]|tara:strand:- start:895 stop:1317 length:423 start_codon:yes stop_codon:yes gene_type:complete